MAGARMTVGRLAPGLIVWAAGLTLGSVADRAPSRPAVILDDGRGSARYTMLAADLHVHGFPGDGSLLPWDLAREARRRGLDVIALTNHNRMLSSQVAAALARWMPGGILVLPGEEVTAPGFHLSALGIARAVPWARTPRQVIDAIHAQGGVAVASHPGEGYAEAYDAAALQGLDGVEAAHPMTEADARNLRALEVFYARAVAAHPGIAAIGSSDFHREAPVGLCRTYLFVIQVSMAGVLEAVREGRTAACDPRGTVRGTEPWASRAGASCRAAAEASGSSAARSGGAINAFAVACALAGMAALVLPRRVRM